ncbi:MAG: pyridoxine 5'-phosphate synthase [Candidatus Pelagibacterales bacterium]|nr:MAG: pyridoxine 5'-phosphate synthase [Pelagibacterales bacterium]
MINKRLGVNIDHVATIRNARGEIYPEPLKAALIAEQSGADSITIHLREDKRHIKESDLKAIKKKIKIPLNLEMAPTREMLKIAKKYKPDYVCIVPEKRKELTTEGGLNLYSQKNLLRKIIISLKKNKIRVSLFVEPKIFDITTSKILGADAVEIHTGKYCNLFNKRKRSQSEFLKIKKSAAYAVKIGMEAHAGHGLNYKSAYTISKIKYISELNIGHFIISDSLFVGLKSSIKKFKNIIKS